MTRRITLTRHALRGIAGLLWAGMSAALQAQPAPPAAPASAPSSPFAGARFTQVTGHGGVPLNAVDKGDADRPAVLFIHGFRQSHLSWSAQFASDLSTRCRLVAFDLRGHGNSGAPWQSEAYDNARPWADDVAAVIATLGLKKPLIVAWSFGGNVAMDFASLHPGVPVAGYLLTATAAGTLAAPAPPPNAPQRPSASPDLALNITALEGSMRLLFPNPALDPALRAQFAAAAMRVPPFVDRAVARRARSSDKVVPGAPLTFVNGGRDPLVAPPIVARLKDYFPGARFVDFPASGHATFLDEPARFNALIDELHCGPR